MALGLAWQKAGVVATIAAAVLGLLPLLVDRCSAPDRRDAGPSSSVEAPDAPPLRDSTLRGRVVDGKDLAPLAGAKVQFESAKGNTLVHTDSEGVFAVPSRYLPSAALVRVDLPGYQPYLRELSANDSDRFITVRLQQLRATKAPQVSAPQERTVEPRVPAPRAEGGEGLSVTEGQLPLYVHSLDGSISVVFREQFGRVVGVFTLALPDATLTAQARGPGSTLEFRSRGEKFFLDILAWNAEVRSARIRIRGG
jgi:hypothetical protein